MSIIAAASLKGGVGKSHLLFQVSGTLVQLNYKILICDNDPQSSISASFLGYSTTRTLDPSSTIYAVHAGLDPYPEQVVSATNFPGIDLLPGHRAAAKFNIPEPHTAPIESQLRVRDFLAEIRDRYDFILIDTAPSLSMATWAALVAADYFITLSQPEDYGSQGAVDVLESAQRVINGPNTDLHLLGLIISMISPRRSLHQLYEKQIRSLYGSKVFAATIPYLSDFSEAVSSRKPISIYKPKSAATRAIRAVTDELLARIATSPQEIADHG